MTNITPGHWYFQTVHPEYWWVTLCLSMLCTCISMLLKLLLVQKFTKDVSPNFPEIVDSYFARYSPVRGWLMAIFASDNFADSCTQSFLPIRTPNNSIHAMIVANQQLMIEWGLFDKEKATSTQTSDANQDDPFQGRNMCDDPVRFFRRFERRGRWPTAFGSLLFCWRGLFVSLLACLLFVCLDSGCIFGLVGNVLGINRDIFQDNIPQPIFGGRGDHSLWQRRVQPRPHWGRPAKDQGHQVHHGGHHHHHHLNHYYHHHHSHN